MTAIIGNNISNCGTGIQIGNNETNINIQDIDKLIIAIEADSSLDSAKKLNIKTALTTLKNFCVSAEPYARPYILKALALAQQNLHPWADNLH